MRKQTMIMNLSPVMLCKRARLWYEQPIIFVSMLIQLLYILHGILIMCLADSFTMQALLGAFSSPGCLR